ncbi:MAG: RDD family protein, partial [Acidobacteriota bacterium]|nr:RDD family protein [Acidobacteriota bacterium]
GFLGATALAVPNFVSPASVHESSTAQANAPLPEIVSRGPAQGSLFPNAPASRNLLFQVFRKTPRVRYAATPVMEPGPRGTVTLGTISNAPPVSQSTLDFLPPAPAGPRKLKTSVEAVIYCNDPVAAPMHRLIASALDASMILSALGIFSAIFYFLVGTLVWDSLTIVVFGAAFILIALFYGLIWAMSARETAGMSWTHLRLINFDGFPPDARSRALRMAGGWLSFCSGTIGLWWALVDEENLTWHDHMSKTFPTFRESNSSFVQQR